MSERIKPQGNPESQEGPDRRTRAELTETQKEMIRENFDLRVQFALAVSEKLHMPIPLAIRRYTDIYAQIGIGGRVASISKEKTELRAAYDAEVEAAGNNREEILRRTMDFFENRRDMSESKRGPHHPFRYDYHAQSHTVFIHFGEMDLTLFDGETAYQSLSSAKRDELRATLRNMFLEIRAQHPDAATVDGDSWLYNLPAYRALFPDEYVSSMQKSDNLPTDSTWSPETSHAAMWGQMYDGRGRVNKKRAEELMEKIRDPDLREIADAFPMQIYAVKAPISVFYKEYGIE